MPAAMHAPFVCPLCERRSFSRSQGLCLTCYQKRWKLRKETKRERDEAVRKDREERMVDQFLRYNKL